GTPLLRVGRRRPSRDDRQCGDGGEKKSLHLVRAPCFVIDRGVQGHAEPLQEGLTTVGRDPAIHDRRRRFVASYWVSGPCPDRTWMALRSGLRVVFHLRRMRGSMRGTMTSATRLPSTMNSAAVIVTPMMIG